jgi:anti-sigma-K factor RskA
MTLPACQQRALDAIESSLEASEPRMKAMFGIFTRLTKDEEPTRAERLPDRPLWRRSGFLHLLVPVLAAVAIMASLVIGLVTSGLSACGTGPPWSRVPRSAVSCPVGVPRPATRPIP